MQTAPDVQATDHAVQAQGEPWAARLLPLEGDELALLEFVAAERRPASRLSCQIVLTAALDGLTVDLPSTQY